MGTLLLNILVVAVGTGVGAAAGWFLRAASPQKPPEPAPAPRPPAEVKPVKAVEPEKTFDHVGAMMSRLHQLTASVAADVDEHSCRVQAMNDELTSGGDAASVVERLMKANAQMQAQLHAAEQRMQQQAKEIESHVKDAHTDALTKLGNRRAFDDEIRRCTEAFLTNDKPSCVMMIDVDHFKKFNDTYGHQAGDEVLRNVGKVLRREASGEEVVCRYGGEEFAVIFPGMDIQTAIPRAEKARAAIALEVVEFQGLDLRVTASGGLAQLQPAETGEALVKRADIALYVCKEKGRNCGYWHDGTTSKPMKGVSAPVPVVAAPAAPSLPPEPVPASVSLPIPTPTPAPITPSAPMTPSTPVTPSTPLPTPAPLPRAVPAPAPATELDEPIFRLMDESDAPKINRRDRIVGLSDYGTFCRDVDRRLAEYQREGVATSLLVLSVDDYQKIADAYGSRAVDLALRTTAQIVKATMRGMDHAARCDANVFALLLPGASTMEASTIAERIRTSVEGCPFVMNNEELRLTISAGVAEFRRNDEREQVLQRAKQSLAAALNAGGNQTMTLGEDGTTLSMSIASDGSRP